MTLWHFPPFPSVDRAGHGLLPGKQSAPHIFPGDQIKVVGGQADAGHPMCIEQNLVIEGDMARAAMRPTIPRHDAAHPVQAARAGGGIVPSHYRSKAVPRKSAAITLAGSKPRATTAPVDSPLMIRGHSAPGVRPRSR